ncbi:hypothetical protein H5T58_03675 [Candidatus Parcubacteria bacterium]|nr:hypothetical protein [Candidatus Parcubacteria bacterium]
MWQILIWGGVIFFVIQILTQTQVLNYASQLFTFEMKKEIEEIKKKVLLPQFLKTSLPPQAKEHLKGKLKITEKDSSNFLVVEFVVFENQLFIKEQFSTTTSPFLGLSFLKTQNEWYFLTFSDEEIKLIRQFIKDLEKRELIKDPQILEGENQKIVSLFLNGNEILGVFSDKDTKTKEIQQLLSSENLIPTQIFIENSILKKAIFTLENLTIEFSFDNLKSEQFVEFENLEGLLIEVFHNIATSF